MSSSKRKPIDLLSSPKPDAEAPPTLVRRQTPQTTSDTFRITEKSYGQQYNTLYFLRLAALKPTLQKLGHEAWGGDYRWEGQYKAHAVERVLDVRQGEVSWVVGTIYLDMPLKPNILDDISRDHFTAPQPVREKFTDSGLDQVMLEDESGRLRMVGSKLDEYELVTGVVVAVLGTEDSNGAFQVIDVILPDLAPMMEKELIKDGDKRGGKVVVASGLGIYGAIQEKLELHLLSEWLLGEAGGDEDVEEAQSIAHLVLAGNSVGSSTTPLAELNTADTKKARAKKYGYNPTLYNPSPTQHFDAFLSSLLPSLPVTVLPGATDPANVSFPQQPLHTAIFPNAKAYDSSTLTRGTNPFLTTIGNHSFLFTSGQNLDDVFKYIEGDSTEQRLEMVERMLRWRIIAPTAPDTLWAYPMKEEDPFVLKCTPDYVVVGNQKEFAVGEVVSGDRRCVIVLVPKFEETGEVVVLDMEGGKVERMCFAAGMDLP